MIRIFILCFYVTMSSAAFCQGTSNIIGARAYGTGNTSACMEDEWSLFNNVGCLAKIKNVASAFSYEVRPNLSGANRMAAIIVTPVKIGVVGFGLYKFGNDSYSEQVATVGYSNTFGLASVGTTLNYIQYHADGFGTRGVLSISAGFLAQLTPLLTVGAHVANINQPKISSLDNERIPTVVVAGMGFKLSEKVFATAEVVKDLDYKPTLKGGLEYQPYKKICFRTGFNAQPNAGYFGFGVKPKKFSIDYAYRYDPNLSANHQASVGYKFN